MNLRVKLVWAAIAAVLAVSAIGSASSEAAQFEAEEYPAKVTGTQEGAEEFSVGGSTLTCKTATYVGELAAASETLAMVPTYAECTAFGFVNATVTGFSSTGCAWHYGANGTASLACVSGDVQIDAGGCTVTLESSKNQGLKSVTYTNNVPVLKWLTQHKEITGLHAVVTSKFPCSITGGTYTNATWKGKTVVIAKNSSGVVISIQVR